MFGGVLKGGKNTGWFTDGRKSICDEGTKLYEGGRGWGNRETPQPCVSVREHRTGGRGGRGKKQVKKTELKAVASPTSQTEKGEAFKAGGQNSPKLPWFFD